MTQDFSARTLLTSEVGRLANKTLEGKKIKGMHLSNHWRKNHKYASDYAVLHLRDYDVTVVADEVTAAFSFYAHTEQMPFDKQKGFSDATNRLDEITTCVRRFDKDKPMDCLMRAIAMKLPYVPGKLIRAFEKSTRHFSNLVK